MLMNALAPMWSARVALLLLCLGELSFGLAPLGVAEHTECLRNVCPRAGGGIRTMVCLPYAPRPVPSVLLREGGAREARLAARLSCGALARAPCDAPCGAPCGALARASSSLVGGYCRGTQAQGLCRALRPLPGSAMNARSLQTEEFAYSDLERCVMQYADPAIWAPARTPADFARRSLLLGALQPTGWDFIVQCRAEGGDIFNRFNPRWHESLSLTCELKASTGHDVAKRGLRAFRADGSPLFAFNAHPLGSLLSETPADLLVFSWQRRIPGALWYHLVVDLHVHRADPWLQVRMQGAY